MTSEHLLNAIGLLDDDLIADAHTEVPSPGPWFRLRRYAPALAACLVLALALGWMAFRLPGAGGGNATGGAGSAVGDLSTGGQPPGSVGGGAFVPVPENPAAPEAPVTPETPAAPDPGNVDGYTGSANFTAPPKPAPTPEQGQEPLPQGLVLWQGVTYTPVQFRDTLPQDATPAGVLEDLSAAADGPATDISQYQGLSLWVAEGDQLYIELPEGGYVLCRPAQP